MMSSSPPPPSHTPGHGSIPPNQGQNQPQNQNHFNFLLSSPQAVGMLGDFHFSDLNATLLTEDFHDQNTQQGSLDFYTTANPQFDSGFTTQGMGGDFIENDDFIGLGGHQLESPSTQATSQQVQHPQGLTPSSSNSSNQIRKSFSNNSLPPQMLFQPQSPQQGLVQQGGNQGVSANQAPHQAPFLTPLRLSHRRNKSKLIEKSPLNGSGNPFYIPSQPSMISPKVQKRTHKKTTSITNSISFSHLDNDLNLNLHSPFDNSPRLKEDDDDDLDTSYVIPNMTERNTLSNLQLPLNTLIEDKMDTNLAVYGDYHQFHQQQQQQQHQQPQQQQPQSAGTEFYMVGEGGLKTHTPLETIGNQRRIQRSKSNFNLSDIAITRSRSSSSVQTPLAQNSTQPPLPSQFVHPNTLRQPQSAPPSQFESMYQGSMPIMTPPTTSNLHVMESPKRRPRRSTASDGSTPSSGSNSANIKFPERLDLPQQSARSKSRSKKGGLNETKKVHECPLCSMKFQRPEHVKRHMLSHSSEKPFVCPEANCAKRFNRNDNLKQHLRNIHKKKI